MSARRRHRRQQIDGSDAPIDPLEGLAPGDLGYRLRGGRTGLDPYDNALEQGRFGGMALKALFSNPIVRAIAIILFATVLVSLVAQGSWTAVGIIAAAVAGVWLLWAIAREDLENIRRRRER